MARNIIASETLVQATIYQKCDYDYAEQDIQQKHFKN